MEAIDQDILAFVAEHPKSGRSAILRGITADSSSSTVWRALKRLVDAGKLEVSGQVRSTVYTIAGSATVRAHLQTPYNQRPSVGYNREFLDAYVPGRSFYLSASERQRLFEAGQPVGGPIKAGTYAKRILEQLLVDLSFASSRMEGNTYDILQTERLIKFGEQVDGKDRKEATMILNHKEAIEYVVKTLDDITLARPDFFNIHALLSDGLLIDPGMAGRLRTTPVGISYSSYKPLDDSIAIEEEFDIIIEKAQAIDDPFEQSFFLLVHIPYLQGFVDINKRTSRVAANVPLLKADLAPMSFLAMDDATYIDGLIGIYELNNVSLLREVYVDSYLASAEKYRILRAEVDTPEKAALAYRGVVREIVRHSVLEIKAFKADEAMAMVKAKDVPEEDQAAVVAYAHQQFKGLHEGNLVRYKLKLADIAEIDLA